MLKTAYICILFNVSGMRFPLLKYVCAAAIVCLSAISASAAETDDSFSYRPNIHGTLRPRYELLTGSGESRFQVRNARLTLDGRVAPQIDYFAQVDLCAKGQFLALDFWARLVITRGLKFQAGQFRMPFGIDTFRAPHTYFFANRSFLGRIMCNYRAVGCKLSYTFAAVPLTVEGGVFNHYAITQHEVWSKEMAYAARALYTPGGFKFSGGIMSICPDGVRSNLLDACAGWSDSRWTVEAEYMYQHYTRNAHRAAHSYTVFGDYRIPVKAGIFNRLSFQGRVDGITGHSNACRDDKGLLVTNNPARNRITIGSTLSYIRSANLFVDIRLDYEKYFYHKDTPAPAGQDDKIVAELVLRF